MKTALIVAALLLGTVAQEATLAAATPKVGDVVWAQWRPNAWYHGKVDKPCTAGLHVAFDDGDQACIAPGLIAVDRSAAAADLKPGTRVLAKWTDGKLYPANVRRGDSGGKVAVQFDDRATLEVQASDTRILPSASVASKVGDVVWAQWTPNSYYHGKIDKACDAGLHVAFDDGDQDCIPAGLIAVDRAPRDADVKAGTRVLAMWNGKLYPATVSEATGGTFKVQFDDGATSSVKAADLRLLQQ